MGDGELPARPEAFPAYLVTGSSAGVYDDLPWIALTFSWQWAFVLTGAFGFTWLALWFWLYDPPESSRRLKKPEFDYIRSDPAEPVLHMPWLSLLGYRQTWAFAMGPRVGSLTLP